MAQKRYYEVVTNVNGQEAVNYIATHSAKDFLPFLMDGEKAKPGRLYKLTDGSTLQYKVITLDYYAESVSMQNEGPKAVIDEPETPASEFTDGLTYSADEMDAEPNGDDSIWTDADSVHISSGVELENCAACAGAKFVKVEDGKCGTHAQEPAKLSFVDWSDSKNYAVDFDNKAVRFYIDGSAQDFANYAREAGYDVRVITIDEYFSVVESDAGVIYHCPWNGQLPYEAMRADDDTAFYFATKAEADAHLREVWNLTHIIEGGERPGEADANENTPCELADIIEDKTGVDYAAEIDARLVAPTTAAMFKPAPAPSKRQQRRRYSALFGVQKVKPGAFTQ